MWSRNNFISISFLYFNREKNQQQTNEMLKIILILLYYTIILISCQFLRPGGDPMLTIGIYHNCLSKNHYNNKKLNNINNDINNNNVNNNNNINTSNTRNNHFKNNNNNNNNNKENENLSEANACQRTARIMMKKQKNTIWNEISEDFKHANTVIKPDDVQYIEMEFCRMEEAVNIMLDLKLNQTFLINNKLQDKPMWNKQYITKWRSRSRILFIMIHAPIKYSRTLASLLYGGDTPAVLLNPNVQIPISLQDKNLVTNYELVRHGQESTLSTVFNERKIKYFAIVWLQDSESLISRIEFELFNKEMTKVYHHLKLCFVLYKLKRNDLNNTRTFLRSVKKDKHLNYIVIFGNQSASINFLWMYRMEMSYRKFHLIFFDLSRKDFTRSFMDVTKTEIFTLNNRNIDSVPTGHLDTIASQVSRRRPLETARTIKTCYDFVINQYTSILRTIDIRQKFGILNTISYADFKKLLYNRLIDKNQMKKVLYLVSMWAGNTVRFYPSKSKDVLASQPCQTIKCGVGKEMVLSNITNNDRLWNQSYGWTCKQCLPTHFKPFDDEKAKCQLCPTLLIPTQDQGGCYDPFVFIIQTFQNSTPDKLVTSLCAIGFLTTLTITIILTKLRNTPLVKALDYQITLVHLILSGILFLACPFVFVGETRELQCTLRPLIILLLCIAPSTLIVGKSQKIVKAFNTKTRLSTSQKRNAMIMQHSISGFIVLMDSAILLLTFVAYPAELVTHIDYMNFTKRTSCNTHLHTNIQIGLLIIQHSFTMIQAYRARNLPGPFNEAMSIVYSSFIGVASCFITFPIFYLQSDKQIKENIHFLVIPSSQLLVLVAFYGKKVWFVVMESQKNTQHYVRHQMMKLAQTQVDNQMLNRKH